MKNNLGTKSKMAAVSIAPLIMGFCAGQSFAQQIPAYMSGFLVPTPETFPPTYKVFNQGYREGSYGFQYDRWVPFVPTRENAVDLGNGVHGWKGNVENQKIRDSQLLGGEYVGTPTNNYESIKQFYETDKRSQKVKEFTFDGHPGVIFKTSNFSQKERETYNLLMKDDDKLFNITLVFETKQPDFSTDAFIKMLGTFNRVK